MPIGKYHLAYLRCLDMSGANCQLGCLWSPAETLPTVADVCADEHASTHGHAGRDGIPRAVR